MKQELTIKYEEYYRNRWLKQTEEDSKRNPLIKGPWLTELTQLKKQHRVAIAPPESTIRPSIKLPKQATIVNKLMRKNYSLLEIRDLLDENLQYLLDLEKRYDLPRSDDEINDG